MLLEAVGAVRLNIGRTAVFCCRGFCYSQSIKALAAQVKKTYTKPTLTRQQKLDTVTALPAGSKV